jgi:hypothetical protein
MTFDEKLKVGKVGESIIANYFKNKGFIILPIYELEIKSGKGPQIFTSEKQLIAPDMFILKDNKCFWIEAKHKNAFTWHRLTNRWVTGIDMRHYQDYCEVDNLTQYPVWLMFLHKGGKAKDSPDNSPSGLFGNTLSYLQKHENHRSDKWGRQGMVYWSIGDLKKICPYEGDEEH